MPVPPISLAPRPLLRDEVFDRLRDAIVDGTLAPDEQLRDTELATWLGVSRTPVREALLELGRSGLVRSLPGRSTVVAPLDAASVRDAQTVVAGDAPPRGRRIRRAVHTSRPRPHARRRTTGSTPRSGRAMRMPRSPPIRTSMPSRSMSAATPPCVR